jgi:hypothetical protein
MSKIAFITLGDEGGSMTINLRGVPCGICFRGRTPPEIVSQCTNYARLVGASGALGDALGRRPPWSSVVRPVNTADRRPQGPKAFWRGRRRP